MTPQPHPLSVLTGHAKGVFAVAFSPEGHTLATASGDNTARLRETNAENVVARICAITGSAMTKNKWDQYLPGLAYWLPRP